MAARLLLLCLLLIGAAHAELVQAARAQASHPIDIAELNAGEAPATLAIGEPSSVLAFVLRQVPERASIYPTENYYYFRFVHKGAPYTGNIRLAAADRDSGKVHFAYGVAPTDRRPSPRVRHLILDASHGVVLSRLSAIEYRLEFRGRAITFVLNDLGAVKPPQKLLATDETFIGAIFDESSVRFFLLFNSRLKTFHYLLDETVPPADEWAAVGDGILIGKRTGFAFYRDGERKVLIGVNARNSQLNTAFDGPFDQLPENSIVGDALRDAITAADPAAKGKIDRLGHYLDGSGRYLIHPYLLYRVPDDLTVFHRCMISKSVPDAQKPRCLVISDQQSRKRKPVPLALQRR